MTNKIIAGLLLTFSLLGTSLAHADMAAGIVIGDPLGFTGRMSVNEKNSVDAVIGASGGSYRGLQIHSTFLFDQLQSWEMASEGPMNLYTGVGARLIFINDGKYDGDVAFGPRVPVGLTYMIADPALELFGELALAMNVAPKVDADLDIGIGVRFKF
ncbi:hypothetical protein [Bdellovibrio sp. HCB274]|uniref:hypothetical protein n=1 Tax=Bdellovibrio sp. HCB274 TaxID=3394361 RepID=UPI0039B5B3C6